MAESNRSVRPFVITFAVAFFVAAAAFAVWRVVLPEAGREHVPIAAGATFLDDGSAWLTVHPGDGPVATAGELLRFEWDSLSRSPSRTSSQRSVREITANELRGQSVGPLLATMRRGEIRRVWVNRNLWYGSRIEAFDVSLISVKSKGREVGGGV